MRTFFGISVEPSELSIIDELVVKRNARSRSDLARMIIAEEARRRRVPVPAGCLDERQPWDRRRRKVSPQVVESVVMLAQAGDRNVDIAAAVDLPENTVTKIRARHGLSVPRGAITKRGTL